MKLKNLTKTPRRKHNPDRFIEIDMIRGLAIILMIFAHLLWDLDYFGIMPLNNQFYSIMQKTVTPFFFLLVGIGLIVSKKRIENMPLKAEKTYYTNLILRGLKIFSLGMILTTATLIAIPGRPVLFGVLHCIGFSMILSVPFLKYRNYTPLFALLFIFMGSLVSQYSIEAPTIFHLAVGLHQTNVFLYTVDYFPLLPWFGVCLLGVVVGDILYSGNERRFRMPDLSKYKPAKIFQWVGQHSLIIYLLHQPVIAGALFVFMTL